MNRRQAIAGLSAMTASLALTSNRSHALEEFSPLSHKEAQALGLKFRAH